jgi:6-phosphogluconate dehydrogenase
MVHNGIEYGDMQLIGEVYDILKQIVGLSNEEMAKLFEEWNDGELESFLIEITYKILGKKDDLTGEGEVVDYVLDKTGMKGTGRWTVQEAAEQSVAAPTIAASLDARYISGRKNERVAASKVLDGPTEIPAVDKDQVIADLQAALYCAKVISYAQGMSIIKAASDKHGWDVDLSLALGCGVVDASFALHSWVRFSMLSHSTSTFPISWWTQPLHQKSMPAKWLGAVSSR